MNKYKVGDKIVLTVSDVNEKAYYSYYVFNNNDLILWEPSTDKYAEPLSTYTEPLERKNENKQKQIEKLVDKLHRQAAEITRLLKENKKLKEESRKLLETSLSRMTEITRLLAENEKLKKDLEYYHTGTDICDMESARIAGQNEAWELVRKIFDMETNDIEDIFIKEDAWNLGTVLNNYTYPEAAAKVAEWEKAKEEIKVGDVVSREGVYGVVKSVSDDWLNGITASGISFQWLKRKCTKTGRHIDIDRFLNQIGGEE